LSVEASKGEEAFLSPLEENLYELNVLPDSECTITAHTNFCDPETISSPLTFLGANAAPELTNTVPEYDVQGNAKGVESKDQELRPVTSLHVEKSPYRSLTRE